MMQLQTTTGSPELVRFVDRKKPDYRIKKCCYCCGSATTGPHHLVPRSEGGLPIFDNIVWLCVPCHDAVEGPSLGAWNRIRERKAECRQREPEPRTTEEDEKPVFTSRLDELRYKRIADGCLGATEAKEYHFLLADIGKMDKISMWCLWNHQDYHAESLKIIAGYPLASLSAGLKEIVAQMPASLSSTLPRPN